MKYIDFALRVIRDFFLLIAFLIVWAAVLLYWLIGILGGKMKKLLLTLILAILISAMVITPAQAEPNKYFDSPQQFIERYEDGLSVYGLNKGVCLDIAEYIQKDCFDDGYIVSIVFTSYKFYIGRNVTNTNGYHAVIQLMDSQGSYWIVDPNDWRAVRLWRAREL